MDNILVFLKQLDLSEIEAKLYLTLLQNGPVSVRDLAETIEIKRTTAYFYIDQLIEKGLITKLIKNSKKMVAANPPEALKHLVEQKVASAKAVEQNFPKMLQTLTTDLPQNNNTGDAEIKYYKGKNGVQKIYEDVVKAKEQRSYVDTEKIQKNFPENFKLFNKTLEENPDVKIFEIFQNSPSAQVNYLKLVSSQKNYFHKVLPEGMQLTAQDILIYDNKVAIISFNDGVTGVVLQNRDLYNNFKTLFDFMWKMLP